MTDVHEGHSRVSRRSQEGRRRPRRPRRWLIIPATAALTVCLALACAETVARALADPPLRGGPFREEVWVGSWATTVERRTSADQLRVTELTPSQRTCSRAGCVTINEDGMRRPVDAPSYRDPGVTTIAMVGDSFTFGYGVSDEDTLPAHLERVFTSNGFPQMRVLNLGMNGMNSVQVSRAARSAAAYRPRVIIYSYSLNDPELFWQEGNPTLAECRALFDRAPLYRRFLARSALVEQSWLAVARRVRDQAWSTGDSHAYFELIHRRSWPGMWATSLALEDMQRTADRVDADLLVVLLPDEMPAEVARRTTGRVAALCRQRDIATLDVLEAYLALPDRSTLWTHHGPSHFNGRGNRVIAEEIFVELVKERGLFAQQPRGSSTSSSERSDLSCRPS